MRFERTKNSAKYFVFGSLNRVVSLFIPFLLRTLVICYLGEEYLGINSLFSSILGVLNLAELGFGTAVATSMYKPVAEDDTDTVCALMALYRKVYRIIGIAVLAVGLSLVPFLNTFVRGECPAGVDIYILYAIYLTSASGGYFLFAYKQTVLSVHQRGDLIEKVSIVVKLGVTIAQTLAIVYFHSIYLYVILNVINNVFCNLICAYIVSKKYPQYHCSGIVEREIKMSIYKKVGGLMIQKLGQMLSTQLDTIIISSFLGLIVVARYGNYLYIANSVGAFIQLFFGAMTAGIGNAIVVNSVDWNYKNLKEIQFIGAWIIGWCSICLSVLYQPFMKIWLGEDKLLPNSTVIFLVIYFYIRYSKCLVVTFKDAAGMWWEDKFKPLVSGVLNLSINIVLVRKIGVNGVIFSTIFSYLFVEIPWETHVLFKKYFKKSEKEYFFMHIKYLVVTGIVGVIAYFLCSFIPDDGILLWIGKAMVCTIVPNVFYFVIYRQKEEFQKARKVVLKLLSRPRKMRAE